MPGWRPDPAWPPAPAGWIFHRTPDGQPAAVPAGGWTPPNTIAPLTAPTATPPGTVPPAAFADPYASGAIPTGDPYASGAVPPPYATGLPYSPVPTAKPRRSQRGLIITGVIVLVIALGAVGISTYSNRNNTPLTQAQFLNFINEQLPADGISGAQFEADVSMSELLDCTAYQNLDDSKTISGAAFADALGGGFSTINFSTRDDAEAAANASESCDSELGYNPTQTTSKVGGVSTWTLDETDPDDGTPHTYDLAVFHNILIYAGDVDPDQWQTFTSTTFPQAVDAAMKAA
jgi:hypothetical protein